MIMRSLVMKIFDNDSVTLIVNSLHDNFLGWKIKRGRIDERT